MDKVLIIVRGIPGCGKSTFAKLLGTAICTTDDFFTDKDGKYTWVGAKVGFAHLWCQSKCKKYMTEGISPVIVANTATTKKELKPYYDLAIGYGYKVFCVIVENRLNTTNIHNVPEETIINMKKRFDISL